MMPGINPNAEIAMAALTEERPATEPTLRSISAAMITSVVVSYQVKPESLEEHVRLIEGDPVSMDLPDTVVLEVTEADPVIKNQTATSSYKPAMLSNGVKTQVPPFIATGEKIVVRTEDASYVERAKG